MMGDNVPSWVVVSLPNFKAGGPISADEERLIQRGLVMLDDYAWNNRLDEKKVYDCIKEGHLKNHNPGYAESEVKNAVALYYRTDTMCWEDFKAKSGMTDHLLPVWLKDQNIQKLKVGGRYYYLKSLVKKAMVWMEEYHKRQTILVHVSAVERSRAARAAKKARKLRETEAGNKAVEGAHT